MGVREAVAQQWGAAVNQSCPGFPEPPAPLPRSSLPPPCPCPTMPVLTMPRPPVLPVVRARLPARSGRSCMCTPRPRRSRPKARLATAAACAAWPNPVRWACWYRAGAPAPALRCDGMRKGWKGWRRWERVRGRAAAACRRGRQRQAVQSPAQAPALQSRLAAMSAAWWPTPARSPGGAAPGRWASCARWPGAGSRRASAAMRRR